MTRPQVDHPDGGEGDAFYVVAFVKPLLMGVRTHPARQGRFFAVTRCVTIRDNPPPRLILRLPNALATALASGHTSALNRLLSVLAPMDQTPHTGCVQGQLVGQVPRWAAPSNGRSRCGNPAAQRHAHHQRDVRGDSL